MEDRNDALYRHVLEKNWVEEKGWAPELVERILARLRAANPNISGKFTILVVWSKEFNAMIDSGNYIYVSRALLERCPNEEAAAFVIAHELAHQQLGHLEIVPPWAQKAPRWAPLMIFWYVIKIFGSLFTPRRECEADVAGLNYCINAGYNPAESISIFDILEHAALNRRSFFSAYGPDDESDDELNENASMITKFNIWLYYISMRSLPIRDRREYLLQYLENRGIPRDRKRVLSKNAA